MKKRGWIVAGSILCFFAVGSLLFLLGRSRGKGWRKEEPLGLMAGRDIVFGGIPFGESQESFCRQHKEATEVAWMEQPGERIWEQELFIKELKAPAKAYYYFGEAGFQEGVYVLEVPEKKWDVVIKRLKAYIGKYEFPSIGEISPLSSLHFGFDDFQKYGYPILMKDEKGQYLRLSQRSLSEGGAKILMLQAYQVKEENKLDIFHYTEGREYTIDTEKQPFEDYYLPELEYKEVILLQLTPFGAWVDPVEWISSLDERWDAEIYGSDAVLGIYNEKQECIGYSFAEGCRFVLMRGPTRWFDVEKKEFWDYQRQREYARWEIGINEDGEIACVRECILP